MWCHWYIFSQSIRYINYFFKKKYWFINVTMYIVSDPFLSVMKWCHRQRFIKRTEILWTKLPRQKSQQNQNNVDPSTEELDWGLIQLVQIVKLTKPPCGDGIGKKWTCLLKKYEIPLQYFKIRKKKQQQTVSDGIFTGLIFSP